MDEPFVFYYTVHQIKYKEKNMESTKRKVLQIIGVCLLGTILIVGSVIGVLFGLFTPTSQIQDTFLNVQGVALAASTVDENTKTLTATIYPESTIDNSVDWRVEWADPDCVSANEQVVSISGGVAYDYLRFDTSYSGSFGYSQYICFENGAVLHGNGSELVLTNNGQIILCTMVRDGIPILISSQIWARLFHTILVRSSKV